jgi:murein DD-endopeptidase MepM/ murein hydrolase activator NlpD
MSLNGKTPKSPRLFNGISWGVTILLVLAILGFGLVRFIPAPVSAAPVATSTQSNGSLSVPTAGQVADNMQAIVRHVWLKTNISSDFRFGTEEYTVQSGDALFSIAKQYNIKPETLLWANSAVLKDNPDNLVPGMVLVVPPTDGVYYEWKDGDTLESVAKTFKAKVDDILNWPGNNIDLTNPEIKAGTYVMVPGGQRELVDWIKPQVARGASGTAGLNSSTCSGPIGTTAFIWPTPSGYHYVSGYDYSSTHLAIDIGAYLGMPVYAADSGVVVTAGWSNSGYGNVIMIDHGNGYLTVYAHLSAVNVALCQGVNVGQQIGLAGSTGNSTGAHLHFEVRMNGGYVNPHFVLPAP